MRISLLTAKNHQEIIKETLATLKSGGLVVFPSDTVYGLLADSTNPKAVDRLLAFKERPAGKAISVFMADKEMAREYIEISQNTNNVINNLLPGPFTIICEAKDRLHQSSNCSRQSLSRVLSRDSNNKSDCPGRIDLRLFAENGTLGIRIPHFPLILNLVKQYGKPLTATSANISGKSPNYSIPSLLNTLSNNKKTLLNLIVDAGKLPANKPSTVIDTTTGQLKTLRFGDFFPASANKLISKSEEQTKKLARFLAAKFVNKTPGRPLVFLLEGDLGTGKTIFAKGLGIALGIREEITSPTFNICSEYQTKLAKSDDWLSGGYDMDNSNQYIHNKHKKTSFNFVHYDLYRIETERELNEINFIESFSCGNIYAIEWPERIQKTFISALINIAEIVYIKIKRIGKNQREIEWRK